MAPQLKGHTLDQLRTELRFAMVIFAGDSSILWRFERALKNIRLCTLFGLIYTPEYFTDPEISEPYDEKAALQKYITDTPWTMEDVRTCFKDVHDRCNVLKFILEKIVSKIRNESNNCLKEIHEEIKSTILNGPDKTKYTRSVDLQHIPSDTQVTSTSTGRFVRCPISNKLKFVDYGEVLSGRQKGSRAVSGKVTGGGQLWIWKKIVVKDVPSTVSDSWLRDMNVWRHWFDKVEERYEKMEEEWLEFGLSPDEVYQEDSELDESDDDYQSERSATSEASSSKAPPSKTPSSKTPPSKTPSSKTPSSKTPSSKTPSSKTPSTGVSSSKALSSKALSSKALSSKALSSKALSSKALSSKALSSKASSTGASTAGKGKGRDDRSSSEKYLKGRSHVYNQASMYAGMNRPNDAFATEEDPERNDGYVSEDPEPNEGYVSEDPEPNEKYDEGENQGWETDDYDFLDQIDECTLDE